MKDILKQANELIDEFEEHLEIFEMLEEREGRDNDTTYTLDEVKEIIKKKRSEWNKRFIAFYENIARRWLGWIKDKN